MCWCRTLLMTSPWPLQELSLSSAWSPRTPFYTSAAGKNAVKTNRSSINANIFNPRLIFKVITTRLCYSINFLLTKILTFSCRFKANVNRSWRCWCWRPFFSVLNKSNVPALSLNLSAVVRETLFMLTQIICELHSVRITSRKISGFGSENLRYFNVLFGAWAIFGQSKHLSWTV